VRLVVGLENRGSTSITGMRLTAELPPELADPFTLNTSYAGRFEPGVSTYVDLGSTCISPSAISNTSYTGVLHVSAQLVTDDGVVYSYEESYRFELFLGDPPGLKIAVLDYGLTSGVDIPGFRNTGLRVLLRSEEPGTLELLYSYVVLENAEHVNGSSMVVYEHETTLSYLETAWISYTGINLHDNATYVKARVLLHGLVSRDGSRYPTSTELLLVVPLSYREIRVGVERSTWQQSYAYPGSSGNNLVLVLYNSETELRVEDAVVEVVAPSGVIYPDKMKAYNVNVNPGSLIEVVFSNILIPVSTEPGVYQFVVRITGTLRARDGSFRYFEVLRYISVPVENQSKLIPLLPVLEVVDVYWGEGTPIYVYPGSARAPLTIVLQNRGIVDAFNVHLYVESVTPNDVEALNSVTECATRLLPGDTCVAVFYFNLSSSSSGLKTISLMAKYNVNLGTNVLQTQRLTAKVHLPEYPAGEGLVISSYMWLNNNPVFPRTRGAVLQLVIANLEPYTVYSVWVNLKTPECMSIREGTPGTLYVSGPLASLQTTTVSFTLDMNNCSVGLHRALVELDYFVQTAGGGVRKRAYHWVSILVQSDEDVIEFLASGWVTTPLEPPVHGAQLYLVFRNRELPSVHSPVLRLHLPPGIVDSRTNSSVATALPIGVSPQQAYTMLFGLPGDAARVIQQLVQQPVVQVVSKGEFIVYIVSLNIERVDSPQLTIPYTLSFVDHWGFVYEVSSNFTISLLTSPPLLEVRTLTPVVVFGNGTAHLDILLVNNYGAPVSNVYVALIPEAGNAIPQGAVKYIEKLDSYSSVKLRYELVYNPVQVLATGGLAVSPTSAVFRVAVLYVDIAGTPRSFNTTLSAMIAPFIELRLVPGATARYTRGSLLVSGVLANMGISAARSVVVYVKYGETEAMSIIGDVDPASQTPFRVEVRTPYADDTCKLVVKYRDIYGSIYEFEEEIRVVYVPEEVTQTPTVQQPPVDLFKLIIIILVAVFLSGVAYIIYRHTKSVAKGSS
ncbi:MAG: hypothetical protein QW764_05595, partial [Desulfurococcaceae archaeon]